MLMDIYLYVQTLLDLAGLQRRHELSFANVNSAFLNPLALDAPSFAPGLSHGIHLERGELMPWNVVLHKVSRSDCTSKVGIWPCAEARVLVEMLINLLRLVSEGE